MTTASVAAGGRARSQLRLAAGAGLSLGRRHLPDCLYAGLAIGLAITLASPAALGDDSGRGHHRHGPGNLSSSFQASGPASRDTSPDIGPSQAAESARGRYGGRVLDVRLEHDSGGPYYRVKLLDGGRVRVVHVDAYR